MPTTCKNCGTYDNKYHDCEKNLKEKVAKLTNENQILENRIRFQAERKDERKKLIAQYENEIKDKNAEIVKLHKDAEHWQKMYATAMGVLDK